MWPPPTNSMSADNLKLLLDIASSTVEHVLPLLKERCSQEGHEWGLETELCEYVGGEYIEGGETFASFRDDWRGGEDVYYFHRQCDRCGKEEKRKAIIKETRLSPFADSQK